ncbi:serine/threonine-protein kinase [Nocardia sp. SYP-A9097]|uniref:serine/threonine-protein kinase n=1 Tax=Nocardia sp. SYP-A9097 TaxID=2663237 RepID=UPI001891D585|nr:serine/threonine-protein kinase [Nocardia sp. SYP-A9097]
MKPLTPRDPQRLGGIRLLTTIGRGGMGRVFLGRTPTGRLVAVKQIHRHLANDPEFQARFQREVDAGRLVTGAYTAAVVDSDTSPENPWLATEYIPAPDLATVLQECGPLPVGGLRLLAAGLAAALVEIHRPGLVHRDLKPGNILLTPEGARVIDFGIARAVETDGQLTATGTMIGSPAYMSPEQAEGRGVTPAADVFSVGAILAMAASGTSPFPGTSTPQILYRIMHSAPSLDQVPSALRELVEACLAKDPAQRPTARELLAATGTITAEPVWPEPVRTHIAAHRADSEWWVETTEKQLAYQDQLAHIRSRRRRVLRWAAVGAVAMLVPAVGGVALSHWAMASGHAVAMADPSLTITPAELRVLDTCKLIDMAVAGKFGARTGDLSQDSKGGCGTDITDAAKRKVTYTLRLGGSVTDRARYDDSTGRSAGWAPILGSEPTGDECGREVITQTGEPAVLEMTAKTPDGDPCDTAEQALTAVVRQLTVYVPLRQLPRESILRVDPCSLFDTAEARALSGDPGKRTATPHSCAVGGSDATITLSLVEKGRPDHSSSGHVKFQAGQYVAYRSTVDLPRRCFLDYLVRPTTGEQGEVLAADISVRSGDVDACAEAGQILAAAIPRLPKP